MNYLKIILLFTLGQLSTLEAMERSAKRAYPSNLEQHQLKRSTQKQIYYDPRLLAYIQNIAERAARKINISGD